MRVEIPLWAVFLGPPAFFTIMVANVLTGGRVVQALEDIHERHIDKQFGWDKAPPGSPEHTRQIKEMHEAAYQRSKRKR
jgi:hypothetical protein